jgi:hypothetical protein
MNAYLTKEQAAACPIHRAIKEEAASRLAATGVFHKEEVLAALGFEAMADAIWWEHISLLLQNEHGCWLVPLGVSFFRHHKRHGELPERYIACGHRKKTHGYAAVVDDDNNRIVIARIVIHKRATEE